MTTDAALPPRGSRWWGWLLAAPAAAAAVALVVYATGLFRRPPPSPAPPAEGPRPDPRLVYAGPYQNIHPEVKFVGDAKCNGCHPEHHDHFREHPMGRSMVPIADLADSQPYGTAARNPFDALGRRFRVLREGGQVWHHQSAIENGEVIFEHRVPVHYAIGSGTRGYSYVTEMNGYLYQTPISWFSEKNIWDLSPGFSPRIILGREVTPGCLQCHVNRVKTIPDETLRYEKGVFAGHAIGCERCHGPGEKHVAWHEVQDRVAELRDFDPTIVNPAKLPAPLRDNVCEQCHLQGEARVLRHGRGWFDYRPGLPLEQFFSTFVKDMEGGSEAKAVNHVEQMHASVCFKKSAGKGKLGCISCHDPHRKPTAGERVAFFRDRCVACHEGPKPTRCKVPADERRRQAPGDSCIDCHMPRGGMTNIAHTSLTDHSVPRDRKTMTRVGRPPGARWGRQPLVHFHYDRVSRDDPEARRDLGLALAHLQSTGQSLRWGRELAPDALRLLDDAVRRAPGDAAAWLGRAEVLLHMNRNDEAATALERTVALWPNDLRPLTLLATLKKDFGKNDEALELRRRVLKLLPHRPNAHREVAALLLEAERWDEARPFVRDWMRLDPSSPEARETWLMYLARDGDKVEARRQMAVLRKMLDPGSPQAQRVERWFARNVGP